MAVVEMKEKNKDEKTAYHHIPHNNAGGSGATPADIVY